MKIKQKCTKQNHEVHFVFFERKFKKINDLSKYSQFEDICKHLCCGRFFLYKTPDIRYSKLKMN